MKRTVSILVILIMLLYSFAPVAFADDPSDGFGPYGQNHQFKNWKGDLTKEQMKALKGRLLQDRIRVNGKHLDFDVPPVIKDGRTLIPVRAITRGLGADVDWDPDTRTVTITRDDTVIILELENNVFYVNGEEQEMDVPASLICNRTFVPLRFIAQALGDRVYYDDDTGDIDIIGRLETPERPTLADYIAEWEEVDNADGGYKLRLFHEAEYVKSIIIDPDDPLEYDFSEEMEDPGCYTVKVTALADGDYLDSKESKPSYPQVVGDCVDENTFEGEIVGLSVTSEMVEVSYEEDDETIIKKVYVTDDTLIVVVDDDDEEEVEFADLNIGDEVTVTLYKGDLIKIAVEASE